MKFLEKRLEETTAVYTRGKGETVEIIIMHMTPSTYYNPIFVSLDFTLKEAQELKVLLDKVIEKAEKNSLIIEKDDEED
jgi:hypothetical protein